ncbi:MAG: glutaredoxin [Spirochaetales bacterium]
MFDQVTFTEVAGPKSSGRLQVLALSTCGFCKRGMDFLRTKEIAFEFVYLDLVEADLKLKSKDEFRQKFGINLSYPSLVKDGEAYTLGYIQRYWEEFLGLPHPDEADEADEAEPVE